MVRPGREPLTGEVEIDETCVGGVEKGGGRRHLGNKAMVVIAAEIRGKGIGRIRMKRIADGSSDSLTTFLREAVEKGGVTVSDGLESYRSLPEHGYRHTRRIVEGRTKASTLLPRVHRVASLLKRWLLGTHQGAVSREHLDSYLDEFAFAATNNYLLPSPHLPDLYIIWRRITFPPAWEMPNNIYPSSLVLVHKRSR